MKNLKKIVSPKSAGRNCIVFFVASFLIVLTNACHKYPEDPFISLRSPEKRLQDKTWYLVSYKINGADSTKNYGPNTGWNDYPYIQFASQRIGGKGWTTFPTCDHGDHWSIEKNQLKFSTILYSCQWQGNNGKHFLPPSTVWKILKLYKNKFKIATTNNKYYEISFETR